MSITNDIRAYADTAIEQGKQVVGQAQHQITGITGTARTNVSALTTNMTHRASGVAIDLRTQAEKTLNLDAVKTAVEPYLAQAKQYRASVTDRAEGLFETVKGDKRVARVVATAESVTGVVVDTVTERVVKPVSALTGLGASRTPARKSPAKKATTKSTNKATSTKAASTRPAAKKTAAKKTTATRSAAKKTSASKTAAKSNA